MPSSDFSRPRSSLSDTEWRALHGAVKKKGKKKGKYESGKPGKRIMEDDPRWDPKTMGNKRGSRPMKPIPPHWERS